MTKLIIDIGSNSIKFLTVSGEDILNKGKTDTGLYSMITSCSPTKHIITRITQLISDIIKTNKKYKPTELFIYATETVRQFEDKDQLIASIKDKFDTELRILSGKEETKFSYEVGSKRFSRETIVVIDLGGASTEISLGQNGRYKEGISLPIGAHNLENIGVIKTEIHSTLNSIYQRILSEYESCREVKFILMGGMVECLSRLEAITAEGNHEYTNLSQFKSFFQTNKNNLTEYRQKATANGVAILDYLLKGELATFNKVYLCREDLRFYFI